MSSNNQYKFCDVCVNKDFNTKVGMVCKLTNSKPDYIGTCDTFEEDESDAKKSWAEVGSYKLSNDSLDQRVKKLESRVSILWGWMIFGIFVVFFSLLVSLILVASAPKV